MNAVVRTDDDSWNITESVGATALGVASARAAETERDNPLISDPFAAMFLAAAGEGTWTMFSNSPLPAALIARYPELPGYRHAMIDYMACRTAFFDEAFTTAADAGVRQVVIMAAGLDARAWRLPWPAGTTVYELDQWQVLAFKAETLRDHQPNAARVDVPVDLRRDWPSALKTAGFDPSAPSTWSVEGLMPYLSAQAQDLLFANIHSLAAPTSSIAVEGLTSDFVDPDRLARRRTRIQRYRAAMAEFNRTPPSNVEELWYLEQRSDVGAWLRAHGWEVSVMTSLELMGRYHRTVPDDLEDAMPSALFVSAHRS